MKTHISIIVFLLLAYVVYPQIQQSKFQVDYNEINGQFTSKDTIKKDFGKYKGYEIELYEGEKVNFLVYSTDFQPSLALVNPNGEMVNHSSGEGKGYANLFTSISRSGNWILYVIGNENATGKFLLRNSIAEPNSFILPDSSDFCTTLDFILAHSNAYFVLMENSSKTNKQTIRLNGAIDKFFDENDGSYNVLYYNGNESKEVDNVFAKLTTQIKNCIGSSWITSSFNWKKVDDFMEKSVTFTEKNVEKPRFITLAAYDFKGSSKRLTNRFNVEVQINKKQ
jgi:hypothetical protein